MTKLKLKLITKNKIYNARNHGVNNEGQGERTCYIDIIIIIMSSSNLYFRIKVIFTKKKTDKMKDLTDCDRLCMLFGHQATIVAEKYLICLKHYLYSPDGVILFCQELMSN